MPFKSKKQELLEYLEESFVLELIFLEIFEEDFGNLLKKKKYI